MEGPDVKIVDWIADGGLANIPVGFIPDHVKIYELGADTAILLYEWFRLQGELASGKQEGISILEGATANLADAGGISAYDTSGIQPSILDYTLARSTAATARTNLAPGTFLKPSTSSPTDKDAIFECIVAGTGSAEPTWPDGIGQNVLDGTVRWERVNQAISARGYKGFTIAAALQTDSAIMIAKCMKATEVVHLGDVDGWTDGISPTP